MRYALGEPKVILEVPRNAQIVKGSNDIKSNITEDASKRITDTVAEQMHQTGRKRRGTNSDLDDRNDPFLVQRKSNKKRRKQENSSVNASGSNNQYVSFIGKILICTLVALFTSIWRVDVLPCFFFF